MSEISSMQFQVENANQAIINVQPPDAYPRYTQNAH